MNKDLIFQTLAQIENNLDRWDQDSFAEVAECGTTACFAGWALLLSGYTLDAQANFYTPHGRRLSWVGVENTAQVLLELEDEQVEEIFYFFPYHMAPKREQFQQFRDYVLAVTGLADES